LLTVAQTAGAINLNYAAREVLESLPGWSAAAAARVMELREATPFGTPQGIESVVPRASGANVTLAASSLYTLTATCTHPESSARRSVRALVEMNAALPARHSIKGWWEDWPFANEVPGAPQDEGSRG
jgi:hypothetical protein